MIRKIPSLALLLSVAALLTNCGKSSKDDKTVPSPQTTATPNPGPTPAPIIPLEAKPEAGFGVLDLIQSGAYCTINRIDSQEKYLLAFVDELGLSYYTVVNGTVKYFTEPTERFQSSCDLTALKPIEPRLVLQSTIRVYANAGLEGEPACTIAPGLSGLNWESVWMSNQGIEIRDLPQPDCKGLERGFIKGELPSFVDVYPI